MSENSSSRFERVTAGRNTRLDADLWKFRSLRRVLPKRITEHAIIRHEKKQ